MFYISHIKENLHLTRESDIQVNKVKCSFYPSHSPSTIYSPLQSHQLPYSSFIPTYYVYIFKISKHNEPQNNLKAIPLSSDKSYLLFSISQ